MAWSAIYNREPGIIETTYIGQMSREELQEAITATVELITANRVYLLFGDAMKLEHDGSIFDIYEMVSVFEQFTVTCSRKMLCSPMRSRVGSPLYFTSTGASPMTQPA